MSVVVAFLSTFKGSVVIVFCKEFRSQLFYKHPSVFYHHYLSPFFCTHLFLYIIFFPHFYPYLFTRTFKKLVDLKFFDISVCRKPKDGNRKQRAESNLNMRFVRFFLRYIGSPEMWWSFIYVTGVFQHSEVPD